MSSGGVLFTTDVPVNVGEAIEYMITLPTGSKSSGLVQLKCVGKVTRFDSETSEPAAKSSREVAATLERYEFTRK